MLDDNNMNPEDYLRPEYLRSIGRMDLIGCEEYTNPEEEFMLDDAEFFFGEISPTTNHDDRRTRVNSLLSCGHCKPHRGMDNSDNHERKQRERNSPKKARTKERHNGRDIKGYTIRDED